MSLNERPPRHTQHRKRQSLQVTLCNIPHHAATPIQSRPSGQDSQGKPLAIVENSQPAAQSGKNPGLNVFGEGEWKIEKHGKERRRIWRKLHLIVNTKTHEVICAGLSLNNVTDAKAFPGLIRQTHRKISARISSRSGAGYWTEEYADRSGRWLISV